MTTFTRIVEVEVEIRTDDETLIEEAALFESERNCHSFQSIDDVLDHLVFNCIRNGVTDARRLDGWSDLEPGTLEMEVVSIF